MKYLRKFESVSDMNAAAQSLDFDFLGLAYNNGVPVMKGTGITPPEPPTPPTPSTSTPFYVENITQQNETLTINSIDVTGGGYLVFPVEYSTDGTTWSSLGTTGATPLTRTLQPNEKVYLRATTNTWLEGDLQTVNIYRACDIVGVSKVGGNIMSLLYGSSFTGNETTFPQNSLANFVNIFALLSSTNGVLRDASQLLLPGTTLTPGCYFNMFAGCSSLTTAPVTLPATTLTFACYNSMFDGCSSLNTAPTLPATTLADYCYSYMFRGCSSLTTAPALPATTLTYYCYGDMFKGCSSLTTAPTLPATTLAQDCYRNMFYGCTALTTAPALPATTLAEHCYYEMFRDCTALTTAPALPATTLAEGCYSIMFRGCSSLTTAPALPATTLASGCYYCMFDSCTSLTTAPALPATTLAEHCYDGMFQSCTSLTAAPALLATTLTDWCYGGMFNSCTNLNYIKCLATNISASDCTYYWVNGVAATGTFVKDPNMSSWTTGINGIPTGWTVVDAQD